MKTLYAALVLSLLMVAVIPSVLAVDTGVGIGIDIEPEEFPPMIWQCDHRVVLEDCVEAGRTTDCSDSGHGDELAERLHNYAFEGEQIKWKVLVMDKNKIEQIQEVAVTLGSTQGTGNDVEVECARIEPHSESIEESCNARIGEERLQFFDPNTMGYYKCIFTVETPESNQGEYYITTEVISEDGEATMDENEFWFLNPIVGITVDGTPEFLNVRPGSTAYSNTILVGNDAEAGSGVMLDMFVSGTDFYDPDFSGALCPRSNRLKLSQDFRSQANLGPNTVFGSQMNNRCDIDEWINNPSEIGRDNHDHLCYYATSGAYGTADGPRADTEGYVPIVYSDQFTRDFYNDAEIIQNGLFGDLNLAGPGTPPQEFYHSGNVLSPGSEIALNFKLGLPEPCVGNFNDGSIYFWGEAI